MTTTWKWKFLAAALGTAAAACDGGRASPVCSADPAPAPEATLVDLSMTARAGDTSLRLGAPVDSADAHAYEVDLFRYYVSHVRVIGPNGPADAVLADANGVPLDYGVALVDLAVPESAQLHLLMPPGHYDRMALSIGVPEHCADGVGLLNHENASEQAPPLDVDSDMYWGWDPGYTFLKIEGHTDGRGFLFHLGDDHRYATAQLWIDLDTGTAGGHEIAFDVNRLFVTPEGDVSPDMTGATTSNIVHGGAEADTIVNNIEGSEVFQWRE